MNCKFSECVNPENRIKINRIGEHMQDCVIQIRQLNKKYSSRQGEVTALTDIDLDVRRGEILGVIGFSGAGKSTLVRCINLLERPDSGEVLFNGGDLLKLKERQLLLKRRKIGMIFQSFHLLQQKTVLKNVLFPLEVAGWKHADAVKRAEELLEEVKLTDKRKSYPAQLSGGQKQRVAIARALALTPEVLLCDEATSALDPETTAQILKLLQEINRKYHLTVVVISHQLNVVKSICHRVAVLENGRICETGEVEQVFSSPASDAARRLLAFEGGLI